jgi:hypothetical protein
LTIPLLTLRIGAFRKVHQQEQKSRIILAGGKPR